MAKKLIEVALPLEEINEAAAKEKMPGIGPHPRGLHLWWARRPLAAARAVLFASIVDDPSDPEYRWPLASNGDLALAGPPREHTEEEIEAERKRLHELIAELVVWRNTTNETLISRARAEILRATNGNPPPLLDPFAGGGAIPLEAQRLGLEAHASDLNPVAVLINKAMIEIPPKFTDQPPVNPEHRHQMKVQWKGAAGLAEDVRYYGQWMRDEAERRIGHLYPKVTLPKEQGGGEATVIAWLWARIVTCPNPACGAEMPLISSFTLSKKKGKEAHVVPHVRSDRTGVDFEVRIGKGDDDETINRKGARCLVCRTAVPFTHIRAEGQRTGLRKQLMAIVAEGRGGRAYVSPDPGHVSIAESAQPSWRPSAKLPNNPRDFKTPNYGMTTFGDLFTERQLVALTTFSDLVSEARERVLADAVAAGKADDPTPMADGGCEAAAYADAVSTYLAFAVDRTADFNSSLTRWVPTNEKVMNTFARQAVPMVWDHTEANVLAEVVGGWPSAIEYLSKCIERTHVKAKSSGTVVQADATTRHVPGQMLISTDPPYYDNIGYADLSDFFYVWIRRTLGDIYPQILRTLQSPKTEELVATPYRFQGGSSEAETFFEKGLQQAFVQMKRMQDDRYPLTVYYAFKQAETERSGSSSPETASTGWETMLEGLIKSGFSVTATWPMRSEQSERMIGQGTNALASSIVLACRVRPENAPEATRQQFLRELRQQLLADLRPLQHANIAPVDLAQAAIGPGMAIYSKYRRVREASGDALRVRGALALINQVLDEVLAEQDEEYDNATRWAVSWYEQYGMNEGPYGDAEGLARARNVGVNDLADEGMVQSGRGKVRFVWREEYPALPAAWSPRADDVSDWAIMQRLAHAVQSGQDAAAAVKAHVDGALPGRTDLARDLAYRVFNIAERKGWTREALVYNTLVQNWADIERLAAELAPSDVEQQLRMNV